MMAVTTSAQPSLLTDDRRFRRLGFLVVFAIFGGLGTWAALAPLSSAALAPRLITAENHRKAA
ncbi:MAG: HlyD family type I secretion periplasmic adaptor subunit, partial [Methylocaldum sp.]|nr:HlyD family type I secretion periplasmic adaptor subunit [Methylocaldum sp.]